MGFNKTIQHLICCISHLTTPFQQGSSYRWANGMLLQKEFFKAALFLVNEAQ